MVDRNGLRCYIHTELDCCETNCDLSTTSYSNFVTDEDKIRPFSVLVRVPVLLS